MTDQTSPVLTDACGKSLPWSAVIELARGNMLASSEPDTTDDVSDADLLMWATGPHGCFEPTQVEAYGHEFVTAP